MDYTRAEGLVLQTREIIAAHSELNIREKGEADFVTDVDLAVSRFLKTRLGELYPQTAFFSDEDEGGLREDCWILDPIDGTTNLIYGYNLSSVSLAHYVNGDVVFGIVYNPFTQEVFTAQKGRGAYYNHTRRLRVSGRDIGQSLIEFGAGSTHKEQADGNFALVKEIFKHCLDIRRICSSALDLCYIAAGRIDGYFEKLLHPWDVAAGYLILREAGGQATDYSGGRLQFAEQTSLVASNGVIHTYLLDTIRKYNG